MAWTGTDADRRDLEQAIAHNSDSELERAQLWQALASERDATERLLAVRHDPTPWLLGEMMRQEGAG